MKTLRALLVLTTVFVLLAVGSAVAAKTPAPDPVPDPQAPTMQPLPTGAPVIRAQAVNNDGAAGVLWGMTLEEIARFVFSIAGTLFVIIMTVWGLTQGKSLADTNARLMAILEERSRNVESIQPLEQLYERSVPETRRETILDGVEAVERLVRLFPNSFANAGVGFVKEVVDEKPIADKLKEAEQRITKLEQQAADNDSSLGGYTVTMNADDA